jgi:hypothetical protein
VISPPIDDIRPSLVRCAIVMRVSEAVCEVWGEGQIQSIPFAAPFPSPRTERVSPGHLVAIATAPDGADLVVWRWYDAVVLGDEADGSVRLWEPAHGEVVASPRPAYRSLEPGSRAYLSAGLPGADWWVAGPVAARPELADVDLDEVVDLYAAHGLWATVFGRPASSQ